MNRASEASYIIIFYVIFAHGHVQRRDCDEAKNIENTKAKIA